MTTLNDEKLRATGLTAGATGDLNDDEVNFVKNLIVAPTTGNNDLETLWNLFWDESLIPAGQFNDRAMAWLATKAQAQGTLNERWLGYWQTVV